MTATIIPFSGHNWFRCKIAQCSCRYCVGGLASCTICGGTEGSLTTNCSGHKLGELLENEILAGRLDYTWKLGWHLPAAKLRYTTPAASDSLPLIYSEDVNGPYPAFERIQFNGIIVTDPDY